jgi:hypothetical protein
MKGYMTAHLSMEAFNALDHFFSGLIPEVEIKEEKNSGAFVWICTYGGMPFYRKCTWAEAFDLYAKNIAKLN